MSKVKTNQKLLYSMDINTPIGQMIAIADGSDLKLLEFIDKNQLSQEIEKLKKCTGSVIISGTSAPLHSIQQELNLYFAGKLKIFTTPLDFMVSPFQTKVWRELKKIPYGETRSYLDVAKQIGNNKAVRAVGMANSKNQFAIILPCHRVINSNGSIGGYSGGISRKQWLLQHESFVIL